MVTIPQGNYDNQKIIIGKQITKDNTPLVYKSPMENMVNLTNNLIPDNSNLKVEMWANSNDYAWNEGSKLSESEVYTAVKDGKLKYCIWDSSNCNTEFFYQKYDVLGLSAQFSTWLNEYNTITGNYGLILEVTFKDLNTQENFAKIYSCQFDSSEFFGDIYNFETYYTQEKVFDLSDYKDSAIVRLRLFPYQRRNFTTIEGEDVPYPNEDDFSNIPPNIYMKDFMISLGTYSNEITEDTAEIMTDSSMTYDKNIQNDLSEYDLVWVANYLLDHKELLPVEAEIITDNLKHLLRLYSSGVIAKIKYEREFESLLTTYGYEDIENNFIIPIMNKRNREINNLKYINLRWIHIFENQVKIVEENEIPEDYEIRWYRYKPGAPSPDQFSGAHWEYLAAAGEESSTLNKVTVEFQPNVNNNEEKIKVIIIKKEKDIQNNFKEYKIATSNVLEFTNNTQIRDNTTFEDIFALTLRADGNFHGNYLLYDRSGKLGKNEWDTEYSVTALFKDQPLAVEDCSLIEWTIPTENTMIKSYKPIGEKDNIVYYYIKNYLDNNATNNTINLKIIKDGLEYTAATTLRFGTAGTNGSNYTMAIEWNSARQAVDLNPENNELIGTIWLYDQSGSPVDLSETTITAEWNTAVDCNLLWNNNQFYYEFEEEKNNIYYPVVFCNKDVKSMWRLVKDSFGENHNEKRQPIAPNAATHGFYYFSDLDASANDYYYYDLNTNQFKRWSKNNYNNENISSFGPVYRKKRDNEKEYIKTQDTTINSSKKYFIYNYDQTEKTYSFTEANPAVEDQLSNYWEQIDHKKYKISFEEIKVSQTATEDSVAYNPQRLYFIKHNNLYIIDPWGEYQENETYYVPILDSPKIRDDLIQSSNVLNTSINGQKITISYDINNPPNINSIYILKIMISNFGDYPLIKYEPIALTNSKTIKYIEGPSDVRYATTGETDFNKNPFSVSNAEDGRWRLIIAEQFDNWNPNEESNQFNPSLKETTVDDNHQIISSESIQIDGQDWLIYKKPILNPPALYYKDAAPYAVQFIQDEQPVWTQPIFVYQDNYPSTTLNQWNGKDIITDNDTGTIVANGFAAGHKNSDNTFSGVVLGDWSRTDIDRSFAVNETGVYGFNHGAMSYALKDDGTAFFGKDGRGRIYIDGNNATIKSASWRYDKPEGMMIDLDDGILDTRSQSSQVYISPNKNNLLNIQVTNGKEKKNILHVGDNSYYLRTANYNKDSQDNPGTGTEINLNTGTITSYNFELDTIKTYKTITDNGSNLDLKKGISLNSSAPKILVRYDQEEEKISPFYLLRLDAEKDYFYLQSKNYNTTNHTGTQINLKQGQITSYNLDLQAFGTVGSYNGNEYDHTGKLLRLNSGAAYYPLKIGTNGNEEFKVTWDGKLIATGAQISGKINATEGGSIAGWQINEDNLYKETSDGKYFIKISSKTKNDKNQEGMGNIFEVRYKENESASSVYPFAVKANGALIASSGQIAGWTINEDNLYKETGDGKYFIKISSKTTDNGENEGMGNIFEVRYKADANTSSVYPFAVKANGTLIANSGRIGSWNISTGAAQSLYKTRTTDDSNDNNVGTIYLGGSTYGIYVNNGTFAVDYSGNMIANSGTFKGKLEGATGTFSGSLQAASGSFSGNITSSTITSGTISGASITGGSISGASITAGGGKFVANSSGVSVTGSITATAYYMGNYTSSFSPQSLDVITSIGMLPDGTIKYINGATISFISLTTTLPSRVYTRSSGCFIAGTKISMADGTYKNIEDVQKNNLILSYDENKSNYVIGKVLRTKKNNISTKIVKILLSNNIEINMTLSHPILTTIGWKALDCNAAFIEHGIVCELLSKNDQIITQNGIFSIKNMVEYNYNLPVYNLTIDKYHTYIANTCIVHNTVVVATEK